MAADGSHGWSFTFGLLKKSANANLPLTVYMVSGGNASQTVTINAQAPIKKEEKRASPEKTAAEGPPQGKITFTSVKQSQDGTCIAEGKAVPVDDKKPLEPGAKVGAAMFLLVGDPPIPVEKVNPDDLKNVDPKGWKFTFSKLELKQSYQLVVFLSKGGSASRPWPVTMPDPAE
jgi:hypothetical protein